MSLQLKVTNRRQFLGRSALGAGSLLFGPLLLESCTDHIIPPTDPSKPIHPPLLGDTDDSDINWNDDAKMTVTTALQLVPDVGGFISALVDIFWPTSGGDVWGKVQTDLAISDEVYNIVKDELGDLDSAAGSGLINYIVSYKNAIKNNDSAEHVYTAYTNATGAFRGAQKLFQDKDNQVTLLPLFAQFANLYLSLLRDGVVYGQSWGQNDADHQTDIKTLTQAISDFSNYAQTTYDTGRTIITTNVKENNIKNEPFASVNRYDRQMTLTVLHYMDTWKYYDVTQYPNGAKNPDGTNINLLTREIYSDPYGNTFRYGSITGHPIVLPSPDDQVKVKPIPIPTQRPNVISVWGGSRIDAVQVTYPAGSGPGGVTQTARMGDQNGGSNQSPHGGVYAISPGNPIIQAQVSYDYASAQPYDQVINTLQFASNDGTTNTTIYPQMGGNEGGFKSGWIGYNYMALSSIYIPGVNVTYNNSANCIVFGFMYWNLPVVTIKPLR